MILFTDAQIEEMIRRIRSDMSDHLGYEIQIEEKSRLAGDNIQFSMSGLKSEDRQDENIIAYYNQLCSDVIKEVGKVFGDN